jgi:hypothetical protein
MEMLDWERTPYHRRTQSEKIKREALMKAWLESNSNYQYDFLGFKIITAAPKAISKHKYTATERLTLDYQGRF